MGEPMRKALPRRKHQAMREFLHSLSEHAKLTSKPNVGRFIEEWEIKYALEWKDSYYKLVGKNRALTEQVEQMRELLERATAIMQFHASCCPLNPLTNRSGTNEHLVEYRRVMRDIDELLSGGGADETV